MSAANDAPAPHQIILLPLSTVRHLTSVTVGDRVVDIVKELIENSLDAHATAIRISLENGGYSLIRVADDGIGIPQESLPLVCRHHATSKLTQISDFPKTETLGYHGEALAEISCFGHVKIMTRTHTDPSVTIAHYAMNLLLRRKTKETKDFPHGTTVEIENLLFNYPEIRENRKNDESEAHKTINLVSKYSIAYPHVVFDLSINGKERFRSLGHGTSLDVFKFIFTEIPLFQKTIEIPNIGRAELSFAGPRNTSKRIPKGIFVNGRLVSAPLLKARLGLAISEIKSTQKLGGKARSGYLVMLTIPREIQNIDSLFARKEVTFPCVQDISDAVAKVIVDEVKVTRPEEPGRSQTFQAGDDANKPKHEGPQTPRKKKAVEKVAPVPQHTAPRHQMPIHQIQTMAPRAPMQQPMQQAIQAPMQAPIQPAIQPIPAIDGFMQPMAGVQMMVSIPQQPLISQYPKVPLPMQHLQLYPQAMAHHQMPRPPTKEVGKDMCDPGLDPRMKVATRPLTEMIDDKSHGKKTRGQKKG